nr:outer membrane protein transport protein [candidate division Zixibacteria bacterium]
MGILRLLTFCLLLLILILPDAFGSGFTFDGLGVKAKGMGGAFRALADDWSAAYYNPAGYNHIADNILAFNTDFLHNRYSMTPSVSWGEEGYESGFYNEQEIYNKHEILSIPQAGVVFRLPVTSKIAALNEVVCGLAAIQLFDQNQTWELYENIPAYASDSGAYPSKQYYNNLDVVAFQLTMATGFLEDERLSVGIGLQLLRADLNFNSVVLRDNPMESPISDRPYDKIPEWYRNDGKGWGFGYRIGLLYRVNEKLDVGLVYNGPASIDITGDTDLKFFFGDNYTLQGNYFDSTEQRYFIDGNVEDVTAEFETTLDLPASIGGGIAFKYNDRLTLTLDGEYTFWSAFEGLDFAFTNYDGLPHSYLTHAISLIRTDMTNPVEWDDVARVMVGANYLLKDYVELRGGFAYDQSPTSSTTATPLFIDLGDKYSYSVGIGFQVDFWHLDFTTVYTHQPDLDVGNISDVDGNGLMDNLSGLYKADNWQTILGISYRF